MSNLPIFDIAGSALQAQSVRMSTIASNLSNADTVAGSADAAGTDLPGCHQQERSEHHLGEGEGDHPERCGADQAL